jgi:hypothetical protein
MIDQSNPYAVFGRDGAVAHAEVNERTAFIRRTYVHLAGAIGAFVLLEAVLLQTIPTETILTYLSGSYSWLIVLGAFMGVSWLANSWARNDASRPMQYAGLSLYVVAESIIFLPLMAMAVRVDPMIPAQAGVITGVIFGGLTAIVFVTKADFSWLGRYLFFAGIAAMGIIVVGIFFGFSLGLFFSAAMVIFAGGYILYDTSNVMNHYRTEQHVAASLALFSSVALLFWYVLQIVMAFGSSD